LKRWGEAKAGASLKNKKKFSGKGSGEKSRVSRGVSTHQKPEEEKREKIQGQKKDAGLTQNWTWHASPAEHELNRE